MVAYSEFPVVSFGFPELKERIGKKREALFEILVYTRKLFYVRIILFSYI
jgi:hypothetical protein